MRQPRGLREVEDELRIRFDGRRGHERSGLKLGEFAGTSSLRQVLRRFGSLGRRSGGSGGNKRGTGGFGGDHVGQQRVVVKASYTVHRRAAKARGVLRAHVSYLTRDSASADGEPGRFYDGRSADASIAGAEAGQRLRQSQWENDRHHFRLIISPERGDLIQEQPGGMSRFVHELMSRMEKDLGTKLQWIAIDHHNTDEPHAHVIVRGKRDNGKDLVIPRQYIKHGMRRAAQEIATRWLGPRTAEQVNEAIAKEIVAERFTPLDAAIERRLDAERHVRLPKDPQSRRHMAGRLQHLQRYGLAEKDDRGQWTVPPEFRQTLEDLGLRQEIIRNLYPVLGHRASSVSRFAAGRDTQSVTGAVVAMGADDVLHDRRYLVLRDARDQLHYAKVSNREALSALETGALVRVFRADPQRMKTDCRIADVARSNSGVYTREAHRRSLPKHFAVSEVESFLRSHERRLQTLARMGAAVREKDGWHIRDTDALSQGDYAQSRDGSGIVEIVSARSIESQTDAEAWTWLDRQIYLRSRGKPASVPFDGGLAQLAQARQRRMMERGYAVMQGDQYVLRSGAADELRQKEWQATAASLTARFGRTPQPLAPGAQATGAYRGTIAMHSGLYAAVAGRLEVYLAPVRRVPPLSYDATVQVSVDTRGRAVLTATAVGRAKSQGLERD